MTYELLLNTCATQTSILVIFDWSNSGFLVLLGLSHTLNSVSTGRVARTSRVIALLIVVRIRDERIVVHSNSLI